MKDEEKHNQFYGHKYDAPETSEGIIDTKTGETKKAEDVTPFDVIKTVAEQSGIEIRDPRKGCKHCYGRGYIGRLVETQQPIPCNCITIPKTATEKETEEYNTRSMTGGGKLNREQRRRQLKYFRRLHKKIKINPEDNTEIYNNPDNIEEE